MRCYWTKRFFAPDYGSIYKVEGLELTDGESYALIERCSAIPEQLIPKAEAGNVQAQYQLGLIYEKGLVMEEKSPELALQWYLREIRRVHESSQEGRGAFPMAEAFRGATCCATGC